MHVCPMTVFIHDAFIDDVFLFITYVRRGVENEKDHALLFRWDVYQPFDEKDEGGGQRTRSGR
ncbi:hypothetical protein BV921_17035 [Pectobacterium odoriferum]|uniref:Uncharacterized protein n=1 Tax=Pectobacterium odoriferum TaxID=78398 RepID=A0ABD6VLU6_9GAMM|nr:hypothetical protein BV925_11110 [Pectobacterium odoriferum]POD94249.1 hypothetical protein BVY06_16300 [Pectobacterium odoriferum]POD99114.1 hypothetical protein BVY05_17770 [Pectobacterium odoriferum]POE01743.1 hypothetical protein BV916_17105 [Pectobacterium odoriferum]POE08087.1 hypothetical protein BV921_17035 [Pectobacterium odoriferum]